jgi:levanase/fructan beta-fructosidase
VLAHIGAENRDPKVVWHAPTHQWVMALFIDGNKFTFYASPDLKQWTHLHDLDVKDCGECPDFFEIPVDGDKGKTKWVWTAANGHYLVGSFDGRQFTPEVGPLVADYGKNYYAVQTYSDIPPADGRRIQIAWMQGGKYPDTPFNQQMSFPCELRLQTTPEGLRLTRRPVKEIEKLHGQSHKFADKTLEPGQNLLAGVTGDLFELRAEIEPGDAAEVGFRIRGEPVMYSVKEKKISCLGASAPLEPVKGRIQLQILVDRSSLEVFGNDGRASLTSCFLPAKDNRTLETVAISGQAKVVSLEVYELRSAWTATR